MNITVAVADIARELGLLERIVGRKPTIPVLANVLIQANAGGLLLSATDLEIGLIGACAATVHEPGAVTLPAKKLVEIVRAQTNANIDLMRDKQGAVRFTSGGFNSRLQSLPAADFPRLPVMDGIETLTLPRAVVKTLIPQVRYAVSDKDQKYFLRGAMLVLHEGELLVAATDSSRIALSKAARDGAAAESVILPTKVLDELLALLSEQGTTDITFAHTERHLFFDLDGRLLISRQIDGKFPNYERIIPKQNEHVADIGREKFVTVMRRLILISPTVLLSLSPSTLDVSSSSADVGEGLESIAVTYDGPKIDIRFNGQYVLDFLGGSASETVRLALKDGASPALFSDGDYINVIMGMRV